MDPEISRLWFLPLSLEREKRSAEPSIPRRDVAEAFIFASLMGLEGWGRHMEQLGLGGYWGKMGHAGQLP
jgi:hypothetical protein